VSSKYSLPSAPLLLLVTDRSRYRDRTLEDILVAAMAGGVNMLELREADMTARNLLGEAERLRQLALGGVPLVIYDRVDVAVAARADGVHVAADSLPISAAKHAGRGMLVGKSVSSVAEAVAAEQSGADYLVIAAGADGVSVTTEIVDAPDPRIAARSLADAMREAWQTRPLLREAMAS
jgi:thiamine-phosphate pyrophosphorylase